ncbi:hypothetical protein OIO90_003280 [Microbotryomycetes sp. JL221]|nr:hypothetical protein OIO90_003280 [Microbotryomycetes sp. JL221]
MTTRNDNDNPTEAGRALNEHAHHVSAERKAMYLHPSSAHSINSTEAQARRRKAALDAQKQRRTHAFDAARSLLSQVDSTMTALSLSASDSETGSSDEASGHSKPPANSIKEPSFPDNEGDIAMNSGASKSATNQTKSRKNTKKARRRVKYQPWAKNLLTQGEVLDLSESLPSDFDQDFCLKVCPKGKRCLCATGTSAALPNTVLYSRVSGRTLCRRRTALPPDCLLDCVYDEQLSVLWVLDVIRWYAQGYLVECDTEFRNFFLASRLSELSAQPCYAVDSTGTLPLVVVLCPVLGSPLTPSTLNPLLSSIQPASMSVNDNAKNAIPIDVSIVPYVDGATGTPIAQTVSIPLEVSGLLAYHKQAQYESGLTALMGWIAVDVEEKDKGSQGITRFKQLVEQWSTGGSQVEQSMEV